MTMLSDVFKILSWVQGLNEKNKRNGIEIKEINHDKPQRSGS